MNTKTTLTDSELIKFLIDNQRILQVALQRDGVDNIQFGNYCHYTWIDINEHEARQDADFERLWYVAREDATNPEVIEFNNKYSICLEDLVCDSTAITPDRAIEAIADLLNESICAFAW